MEVWDLLLGRGIQDAITFSLVWVFCEVDLIQTQVGKEISKEGPLPMPF